MQAAAAAHHRRDIEGEPWPLIVNKNRAPSAAPPSRPPGFGDRRKAMLEDIAFLTGATVISEEVASARERDPHLLGQARKVIVTKDDTTIVEARRPRSGQAGSTRSVPSSRRRLGLRPGEAPGAPRQAGRWRGIIKVGAPPEVD